MLACDIKSVFFFLKSLKISIIVLEDHAKGSLASFFLLQKAPFLSFFFFGRIVLWFKSVTIKRFSLMFLWFKTTGFVFEFWCNNNNWTLCVPFNNTRTIHLTGLLLKFGVEKNGGLILLFLSIARKLNSRADLREVEGPTVIS